MSGSGSINDTSRETSSCAASFPAMAVDACADAVEAVSTRVETNCGGGITIIGANDSAVSLGKALSAPWVKAS